MKLKKSSLEQAGAANQEGAFIAARLRNPQDELPKDTGSDKGAMICSILITLILIGIAAMQYIEWDLIKGA
ncbi:MAG: hypothetical protein J6U40_11490 [Kiritimatiellae bacterium]|nr:hypothetical protein [Kiritimatiellia bacterium]MBP5227135.1 hypothetical protein [Kiritimatiellia bacterium]